MSEQKVQASLAKLRRLVCLSNEQNNPVTSVPTMLLPPEQHFLRSVAQEYYSGEGDIFDGGIWLGGCTDCFSKGLAGREDLPKRVVLHAYDMATAVDGHQHYLQRWGVDRKPGESTLDIIEKHIAAMPCSAQIEFHHGDILHQEYPESIEIMFLDVCKTQSINYGMQQLFSRLIPGKSIIIHQDYIHPWNPYIHATMGYLADFFEPVGAVWFNSMVFLLKKEIPQAVLSKDPYQYASTEEILGYIMKYAEMLKSDAQVTELHLACAIMLYDKGAYEKCFEFLNAVQTRDCFSDEVRNVTEFIMNNMQNTLDVLSKSKKYTGEG